MSEKISVMISEEEISKRAGELAEQIARDYAGKTIRMICVLKGGYYFMSELSKRIPEDVPVELDFMSVSSYGDDTKSSGVVKIVKDLDKPVVGKHVVLVEDIVDSGMTLHYLKKVFANREAASVSIVTLLDKPARRRVDLKVDYSCFNIPDAFVVGYGLDYDEKYRNLPDIGVLHPRIYANEEK